MVNLTNRAQLSDSRRAGGAVVSSHTNNQEGEAKSPRGSNSMISKHIKQMLEKETER